VNNQFSGFNMLRRFYPPTLTDFNRMNALVFTSGIMPVVSLFFVRRDDVQQWILAITALVYFGILYIQTWTSLHQFTLIMLLPPLVFWRLYLRMPNSRKRWVLPIVSISTLAAMILSLPPHFQINQSVRRFGQATDFRIGDYKQNYEKAIKAGSGFSSLIHTDYRLHYPNQPWGADSPSLIYYSFQEKSPGTEINYLIQSDKLPQPEGYSLAGTEEGVAGYVRDIERWQRDLEDDFPKVSISSLYEPILRNSYQFFCRYARQVGSSDC
jgi:hypothetical protein